MLGCNEYRITGCNELSNEETKSLVLLYHELTPHLATYLYTLMVYQDKTSFRKLSDLLVELNFSLDTFETLIYELEAVGLIDTYQNHNQLIFVVKKPKLYAELIHDEVYGRLLLKKVGSDHYRYLVSLMKPSVNLDGFEKINHSLASDVLANWNQNQEVIFNNVAEFKDQSEAEIKGIFDIQHFLKSVSSTLFPVSLRTYENLKAIVECADTYGIDEQQMRLFLNKAIKLSPLSFDLRYLKNLCLNAQNAVETTTEPEDPYRLSNVTFFEKLQGKSATFNDKRLIGKLSEEYHLNVEVINVLLEFAYRECNRQLIPNFIYAIASNWYRNDIDNKEKALAKLKENQSYPKRQNKNTRITEQVPTYDSSQNIEISDDLMNKYFGNK